MLSEWIMIMAPIERVEIPQDVYQTNLRCASVSSYITSNILEKFWPK